VFGGTHPRTTTRALRLGLAATGVSALLAAFAGSASAEDPAEGTGAATAQAVTATPHAGDTIGTLFGAGADSGGAEVDRITLTVDGAAEDVTTYCIDLRTNLQAEKTYTEGNWDTANPGSDMPHILWVLEHSVPNTAVADVLSAAKATVPGDEARREEVVYVATQGAVWHFSDRFELDKGRHGSDLTDAEFAGVVAVYDYLTGPANTGMGEPAPTLAITPESASGTVGRRIGPFTVSTTARSVALSSPEGARIVGEDGAPLDKAGNGQRFSVVLDRAGTATVEARGSGVVPAGRIFVLDGNPDGGQKLVLAQPSTVEVAARVTVEARAATPSTPTPTASASPTPQPRSLANTGASPWPKVGIAAVLLLVGTGLLVVTRRRRRSAA
jgi:TQXA domain-containing protein/LPXTG-motif cell wall-anchored protein